MSARLLALAVLHATIEDLERAQFIPELRRARDTADARTRRAIERQYAEILRDAHAAIEFLRSDMLDCWCALADIDAMRFRRRARLVARESLRHMRHAEEKPHRDNNGDGEHSDR